MKKLITLFWLLIFAITATAQKNFELITKKLTPGSTISFEYMPRNTVLQGVKDFEATAYLFEGGMPRAIEVSLKQEGGIYRGSVKTADTTKAVFFSFEKDEKQDNNNDEGYYTPLFDKNGKEVLGAHAAVANAFNGLGNFLFGLKSNAEKATALDKQEYANSLARNKYPLGYFQHLLQSKHEADKELLKAELAKYTERTDVSEEDLQQVKNIYERSLKDVENGKAVLAKIKARFPNGSWKLTESMSGINKQKTLAEKEALYKAVVTSLKNPTTNDKQALDFLTGRLAEAFADSGDYAKARTYFLTIKSKEARANSLNNLAWKLAGEGISKKPVDAKAGLEFSTLSLAAMKEEMATLAGKPSFQTAKQYRRNLESTYYNFADTYATLLYHNGEYDKAYTMEKEAVEGFRRKNPDINEAFALLTEKTKGPETARQELERFFEEGKYTPGMKQQLQRLYTASGKTEAQWTSYMSNLEQAAYNKLRADLAKKMLNQPAPQFALKDMKGQQVALSSLKGKIVVVDFWATWCAPCIASFPGMQMAVNKYKDNPDVAFVFIDTWENDSNRVQKVTDFIAKNKYTFQVLYDETKDANSEEFKVVKSYEVDGIPTKFVIDRTGAIRFKSVGNGGNADGLVTELSAMIDIAAAESGGPVKKAF